jgi:hypothetical protein
VTVDLSANEAHDHEFEPHWQPQGWVFAPADEVDATRKQIRAEFPRSESVKRPVRILPWDGNLAALAYGLKNTFVRRVSYHTEPREDGSRGTCRNTRDRDLRVDQRLEALFTLHQAGWDSRLQLLGAHVARTTNGPRIRPLTDGGR